MDALNSFKKLLSLILPLIFLNITVCAELPEELRKEVITLIRVGYLEFPEHESNALPIGSVIVNSTELSNAFMQFGVQTIQKGFPEFTDDDTIRTTECGYTFLIPQFSRIFRLQLSSEENVDTLIATLSSMLDIIGYAEKNTDAQLAGEVIPTDEYFLTRQWYLRNRRYGSFNKDIHASEAWALSSYKGNLNVRVGVFDVGVFLSHPDLNGRVTGDEYEQNGGPVKYHGTCVSGLIGAKTNNGIGIAGVDWNCQIISKKIFNSYNQFLGDVNAANKIIEATDVGVDIMNHSWGISWADFNITLQLAFVYAYKHDVTAVNSMGNITINPITQYPAEFQDLLIPVGATNIHDERAPYSNYGMCIRVSAPGGTNFGSQPCSTCIEGIFSTYGGDELYNHFWGTSFAAPLVTGLASLIKGKRTSLCNEDIKNIICSTADDVNWDQYPGWDLYLGYGRINCRRALEWTSSPYNFTYFTTTGTGGTATLDGSAMFTPWGISGLTDGQSYWGYRYRVKKQVNITSNTDIWGRGNITRLEGYNGFFSSQHGIGYTYARKINQTTAELQTFVYHLFDWQHPPFNQIGWFPCGNTDVILGYTLHGISRFRNYEGVDRQQVGGCPWIFVHNTSDTSWFVGDNNILHRSEIAENNGIDITDIYKLNVIPNLTSESEYSIKIIKTENDYGYIDKVSFKAIDHAAGTNIGVTENNQIVMYNVSDRSSSHAAELNSQNNITRYIRYEYGGGHRVIGVASDSVTAMDFEDSGQPSGDSLALIFAVSNNHELYSDEQVKEYAGEVSMYLNSSPLPQTKKFARRENESVVIIPIADVDATVDSTIITWYRDYDLKYLFVAPVSYSGFTVTDIPLISAIHTVTGDVATQVANIDGNYANLDSISMITLSYYNVAPPQSGLVRDYAFEITGRYEKNESMGDQMVKIKKENSIPIENKLYNNYPNPFNPSTIIKFSVKSDRLVKLVIYDLLGREVKTLINEFKQKGSYSITFNATNYASGIYFYRIEAGSFVETKKMVLIK